MAGGDRNTHIRTGLVIGALPAAVLMLAAGGQAAARVVAIALIALLVLSYLRVGASIARAPRSERVRRRLERDRAYHLRVMAGVPLIVFALHPWGFDTIAVMLLVALLCQAVLVYVVATVVLTRARRERLRQRRRERWDESRRGRGLPSTYRSV